MARAIYRYHRLVVAVVVEVAAVAAGRVFHQAVSQSVRGKTRLARRRDRVSHIGARHIVTRRYGRPCACTYVHGSSSSVLLTRA